MSKTRRRFSVDTLFADTTPRGVGVADLLEAKQIQLERIEPDPDQPRRAFDDERLDELAAAIRAEGVLQPIAVRYDEPRDVYVILHGERRWRAAGRAGLPSIPAIVREVPEDRRLLQQLMENIVREDLNAVDRAAALRALKARLGDASWDKVAEAVGIRRSRLFQLLGTEKLDPSLQDAIRRGLVSEKQTRALHDLQPEQQADLGGRILAGALDGRQLDAAAGALRGGGSAPADDPDAAHARVARQLSDARHRARALATTLTALDPASLASVDPHAATALAADLNAARAAIDAALAALRGDR
jgi:ParB family chromosome partitioning protein